MPFKPTSTSAQALPLDLPEALAGLAVELTALRGDSLYRCGESVRYLYFVQHGEVVALRPMPDGGEAVMMTARSGEFFGEPSLFVTHYTCEARALADSNLIAWPVSAFNVALNSEPHFAFNFMRFMARKMRMQCSRLERLRLKHADQRILHYLTCGANVEGWINLPGTSQEWASELGLEAATLYRTLTQMEKDGKIERDKRRVRLACVSGMSCAHLG